MIPENAKKVFNENLWYIATCGDEPNVVPVGFKRVCDDGKLAIGAVLLETTLENIKANGKVAVACANPLTGEAYQIKGTAELVYEGEAYEHYCKLTKDTFKAAMYLEMLNSNGIKAKLIQEAENCRVYDLVEIRVFMNKLREINSDSPTIDADNWKTAMDAMKEYNNGSTQLDDCIRFLEGFRSMYSRIYMSDLEEYLYESELSDMFEVEDDVVTVSTIHKSKGREFGTVYLATKGKFEQSDAERRKIYVGMTRAKDNLFICTMGNSFDEFAPMCDDEQRESYNRMVILLGMRDIFLDTAMQYKKLIFKLKAGQEIFLENYDYCMICNGKKYRVCTLSKRGKAKISSEISKGYRIEKTVVRALAAWNPQGEETEYPQILTYVYMRRGQ